jgi:hypothetical protein
VPLTLILSPKESYMVGTTHHQENESTTVMLSTLSLPDSFWTLLPRNKLKKYITFTCFMVKEKKESDILLPISRDAWLLIMLFLP